MRAKLMFEEHYRGVVKRESDRKRGRNGG